MGEVFSISPDNYTGRHRVQENQEQLESAIIAWIAERPRKYASRKPGDYQKRMLEDFRRVTGLKVDIETLEVALAVCGWREGLHYVNGQPLWLILLTNENIE